MILLNRSEWIILIRSVGDGFVANDCKNIIRIVAVKQRSYECGRIYYGITQSNRV